MSEFSSNAWSKDLLNTKVVMISQNPLYMQRVPMAKLHVYSNIKESFKYLNEKLGPKLEMVKENLEDTIINPRKFGMENEGAYLSRETPIKPQRIMRELVKLTSPKVAFFADSGNSYVWATHYLHPEDRRMVGERDSLRLPFRGCYEYSPMGWAIGASIGAAMANTDMPVVCITGDGSVLMNGQEMTVAASLNLKIVFVILNDSSLGMVEHGQQLQYGKAFGNEIGFVDFAKVAQGYGIDAEVINSAYDLKKGKLGMIESLTGPLVLDVRIDAEEVPPMSSRVSALKHKE